MKKTRIIIISALAFLLTFGAVSAAYPTTLTNWVTGNVITSAWLNTVENMLGTGPSKGALHVGATASTTSWLSAGTNGYVLTASSSASTGLAWVLSESGITTTTGNWLGTWQSKNPSDFLSSSTTYVATESDPIVKAQTGIITSNGSTISAITNNSTNWDTAYTDRLKWDGESTGLTAATGRTSLGLTDTGTFASTTWAKVANNLSDLQSTSTARTNLGVDVTKATNKKYIQWTASYSTSTQTWFTPIFTFPNSATITRVLENSTSTGNNLTYNLYYSTSNTPKASMFKVFSADRTLAALSAPTSTTTFASSTPAAMSGLWIDQYNASSTDLNITIEWVEN